ncbi:hypothetical protein CYMTET_4058 [Cymbomonas tetramitiformis]|uniref:Uncharacterized protein n=1 Tax=Cymbomonas tetramitiformis TaxID=36881 RepID=A0AAE0H201_9CHLO|nr:hypothetical protein CYMTET_4058 [Cymbomonas tetramitiformis]
MDRLRESMVDDPGNFCAAAVGVADPGADPGSAKELRGGSPINALSAIEYPKRSFGSHPGATAGKETQTAAASGPGSDALLRGKRCIRPYGGRPGPRRPNRTTVLNMSPQKPVGTSNPIGGGSPFSSKDVDSVDQVRNPRLPSGAVGAYAAGRCWHRRLVEGCLSCKASIVELSGLRGLPAVSSPSSALRASPPSL